MLDFPDSPTDGQVSQQPNGVTYVYNAAKTRWDVSGSAQVTATIAIGMVASFPHGNPGSAWLFCDGSAVSRETYAALFSAIGTTYGNGDGSTTFNLPDYRGEFLRGQDDGALNDLEAANRTDRGDGTTGDQVGTKQAEMVGPHLHAFQFTNLGSASGGNNVMRQTADTISKDTELNTGTQNNPRNVNVRYYIFAGETIAAEPINVAQNITVKYPDYVAGTNLMPHSSNAPINTDGDEYMSVTIIPKQIGSTIKVEAIWYGSTASISNFSVALFRDSEVDALAAVARDSVATRPMTIPIGYEMVATSLDPITFKVRAGSNSAGNTNFNGANNAQIFTGVAGSFISVKEIATRPVPPTSRAVLGPVALTGATVDIDLPSNDWRKATIHVVGTTQTAGNPQPQLRLGTGGVALETGVYEVVVARQVNTSNDATLGGLTQTGFPWDTVEQTSKQNLRFTIERIGNSNMYYFTNQSTLPSTARAMNGSGLVDLGGLCDLFRFAWAPTFTAGDVYITLED